MIRVQLAGAAMAVLYQRYAQLSDTDALHVADVITAAPHERVGGKKQRRRN